MRNRMMQHLLVVVGGVLIASCGVPEIDGTRWRCERHSDCGSGWICDTFLKSCTVADSGGRNGVFEDRLVVGMSAAFTGMWKESGLAARAGFQAYKDHINRTGGVAGRNLQDLEELDDAGDPATARENMAQLVGGEKRAVFALVGSTASAVSEDVRRFAVDSRTLLFAPLSGANVLRKAPPDRHVFNLRASLDQEMVKLLGYFNGVLQPSVDRRNIAVFAQGTDTAGTRDDFGQASFDAIATVLGSGAPKVSPNEILAVTHDRAAKTLNVKAAVTGLLKWLASDSRIKTNGKISALVVLAASPQASAAVVKGLLDAVSEARGGAGDNQDYGLTVEQEEEVATVDRLLFGSTASVDSVTLTTVLRGQGDYTVDGTNAKRNYCEGLVSSQVLPDLTASSTGVLEFRDRLKASDPTQPVTYAAFEGYTLARLLVEGLERHGHDLTVESFINTLEDLRNVDIGVFQSSGLGFTSDDHQASNDVRGTRVRADCTQESIQLTK